MNPTKLRLRLWQFRYVNAAILSTCTLPPTVLAQTSDEGPLQEVVVTGTQHERPAFDTPLTAVQMNESDLARYRASGQADILSTIPGVKAEGGGGELAANVQVRALPSSGQYQFTPLEYNGVPTFSTFGLNSSAFDVYARDDLGVERLEYVTGGVSNLFGPGSVAGIINYIDKTGSETPEAIVQTEFADRKRFRGDLFASGPLAGKDSNNFYALSGFYRYDEGPLETGLATNGFQLRGNVKHVLEDGSGTFTLYGQLIDDRAQYFVPVPLDPVNKERVNGIDGRKVFSMDTNAIDGMRVLLNDGFYTLDHVGDGVATSGGALYGVFDRKIGTGWRMNVKTKYAKYEHRFGLFDATDGQVNVPETESQFVANRNLGAAGTPVFTYASSGRPVASNALLMASRFTDRDRPATDYTGEVSLTKSFDAAFTDDVTFGGFISRAEARDYTRTVRYLTDFKNQPDLVSLTFVNGGTTTGTYSLNGYTGEVGFANNKHSALRTALYVANQMQGTRWAVDAGARVERIEGTLTRETSRNIAIDPALYSQQTGAVAPMSNLLTVANGSGVFQRGNVHTVGWDLSVGGLYKLTDTVHLYANASRGFFFPELRSVQFNSQGLPQSFEPETVVMAEGGLKLATARLFGSLAGFYVTDKNRRQVQFVNGPGGSIIESVNGLATKGYGVELNGQYRLGAGFSFSGNVTLQDHKYTQYDATPAFVGNPILRKPKVLANVALSYDSGPFSAAIFDDYQGKAFANDSGLDAVRLDPYHLVRLDLAYRMKLADAQTMQLAFDVFNLFDSQGLAEGNPRAFNAQTGTEAYFVGRPILPRRFTLRAIYSF